MSKENKLISEKIKKLDKLVEWFDGGEFELEESIQKFNEAENLAKEIENDLMKLKNEVNVIKNKFDKE